MDGAELARLKDVLRDGRASEATAHELQAWFQSVPRASAKPPGNPGSNAQGKSQRSTSQVKTKSRKAQLVVVREDEPSVLSARQQYALATDVLSICLHVLADSVKSINSAPSNARSSKKATTETPNRTLQSCSGNAAAVTPTPTKLKAATTVLCRAAGNGPSSHIANTAECAQHAFAHLLATNPRSIGVREMPAWQIENALLSFSGNLCIHGLYQMAIKPLRYVKRSLEACFAPSMQTKTKKAPVHAYKGVERETLATMLQLDCSPICGTQALAIATTYHVRILRILASHSKPATREEAVQYLEDPSPNSPINLIIRHVEDGEDNTKAAKQLDQLSTTILSMCPSIGSDADQAAQDSTMVPSPKAVFKLQMLALVIRKQWWSIAKHQPDVSKELLHPFWKYAMAFSRRRPQLDDPADIYDLVSGSFQSFSLGFHEWKPPAVLHLNILDILFVCAEEAGRYDEAEKWSTIMVEVFSELEENHALRLVAMIRKFTLQVRSSISAFDLHSTLKLLTRTLSGNGAEFDLLVKALADLTIALGDLKSSVERIHVRQFASAASTLALRYTRAYPLKNLLCVQQIFDTALRLSTTDDLLAWIRHDAAAVFVRSGVLSTISSDSTTRPLPIAWSRSGLALSFSRMLQALLLKTVRSNGDSKAPLFFDDAALPSSNRGVLLEWQLIYLSSLTNKTKYHDALGKILLELLRSLSQIYTGNAFPIRKARIATLVIRLRESHPKLIPPHLFQAWHDYHLEDREDLGEDVGLQGFYKDIDAAMTVSQLFSHNRPSVKDLRPSLRVWEEICDASETSTPIRQRIYDPENLAQQLASIAAYFGMLGDDRACLATRRLLVKLTKILDESSCTHVHALMELARQYLQLGYAEAAEEVIMRAETISRADMSPHLASLDYHIASAECCMLTDSLERCRMSLDNAKEQLPLCDLKKMSDNEKGLYGVLHARAWLIQSSYSLEAGAPHEALAAAKKSVTIVNSLWSKIENPCEDRRGQPPLDREQPVECNVRTLTKGISKLQLQPTTKSQYMSEDNATRGAAFWSLVPILCRALLQLSDMYTHHGIFHDSNYHSEAALRVAESVGSTTLLSHVRSHRSRLLVLAGRIQDAELCLAQDEKTASYEPSLSLVDRYCALAFVRRQDSLRESIVLYEKAETVIACLATSAFIERSESFSFEPSLLENDFDTLSLDERRIEMNQRNTGKTRSAIKSRKPPQKSKAMQTTSGSANKGTSIPKTTVSEEPSPGGFRILQKRRADVRVSKALMQTLDGYDNRWTLDQVDQSSACKAWSFGLTHARYQEMMRKATNELEMDVVLSVLRESTLCIPALEHSKPVQVLSSKSTPGAESTAKRPKAGVKSIVKTLKKETIGPADYTSLLRAAREMLLKAHHTKIRHYGTADMHRACAMLLNAGSLLSSIAKPDTVGEVNSQTESLMIESPRCNALQYERYAVSLHASNTTFSELPWPIHDTDYHLTKSISAIEFQRDFVDILPKTWTAVSLCLSENASELYISRYDSSRTPLVLRLPFSRHKPDGLEDEVFDFFKGKAELQEIVDLSNYTCHNPGNLDVKAVKSRWWSERQALDRRLQELLINIENIWFGGFRGVFAQFTEDADNLSRFRKSFEEILNRYLPSRQASKVQKEALSLDNRVLELFIGLGNDRHGAVDLDEPLCDLLYFVVDMLQFGGERNAYDEIDFDSMAVDVLDALRSYHEGSSSTHDEGRHLILVLDRRLHAFPWESLPCMEALNVSRVGSMLSLRERILAQRASRGKQSHGRGDTPYAISASGTYILNPSSDLPRTQAMLEPTLSKLSTGWKGIVAEEPDEARFTSAITSSSILLYFGHGAGSQFMRPGTIRRQGTCCNVAWLMGCSSGAVTENGDLEPSAVPLAYLLAGGIQEDAADVDGPKSLCGAVVATLWDVTDKDIDRFSLRLGEEWGLWPPSEESKLPTKTPRKRTMVGAPGTPQQVPKTPKTPKVLRSPAPFKTPARDRGQASKRTGQKTSLVEALCRSREACYLRYLNGAAPVVYGVPVYLEK